MKRDEDSCGWRDWVVIPHRKAVTYLDSLHRDGAVFTKAVLRFLKDYYDWRRVMGTQLELPCITNWVILKQDDSIPRQDSDLDV